MKLSTTFICLFSLILSLAFSVDGYTKQNQKEKPVRQFPTGCTPLGFSMKESDLTFKPIVFDSPQTIYFLHNISNKKIHLTSPPREDDLVSPNFDTDIDSNRWAAFAMDREQILFKCMTLSRDEEKNPVDCASSLEVCQYPCVKFAAHNGGNYWPSHNLSRQETINEVNHNVGILLRVCPRGTLPNM